MLYVTGVCMDFECGKEPGKPLEFTPPHYTFFTMMVACRCHNLLSSSYSPDKDRENIHYTGQRARSFFRHARQFHPLCSGRKREYGGPRARICPLTRGNMDKKTSNRKKVGRDTHGVGRCVDKTFCVDFLDTDDAENAVINYLSASSVHSASKKSYFDTSPMRQYRPR